MNKDIKYWSDLSKYDRDSADVMYKSGRYLYVLFMCQQSVEKMLKGLAVQETNDFPPRTHDLERLARLCRLDLDAGQLMFLRALTTYYIETRYPEDIARIGAEVDKKLTARYLKETKEFLRWLKTKLA